MSCTCSPQALLSASHPTLWAVKTYLDLISKSDRLTYGSGLSRLYTLSAGLATLNETDIIDMTNKAVKMNLIPKSLDTFMGMSILKNCYLYGTLLSDIITDRVIGIANGDIENPPETVRHNPERARRAYYVPPVTFVRRLQKALIGEFDSTSPVRLEDVALETNLLMAQLERNEGVNTPTQASWGALVSCVEKLLELLRSESIYGADRNDYKLRARPALKILWFIAKLLTGDLTDKPSRADMMAVDLDRRVCMSDGTLAAIPFPIKQSTSIFEEYELSSGISMKGRAYLAAVAAAAFHRCKTSEEG